MATLTIAGQPRDLRLDYRTVEFAERSMTRSVLEVLGQHSALFKIAEMSALIHAAWSRRGQERTITPESVRKLLDRYLDDGGSILTIQTAVNDALVEGGMFGHVEPPAPEDGDVRPPVGAEAGGSATS